MTVVVQIMEDIVFLVVIGLALFLVEKNRDRLAKVARQILIGITFGLAAALVTLTPVTLGDGATVDGRAGPVIMAGIVAGPIGAVIAGLLGASARGVIGGGFALSGVIVYAVYALVGLVLGQLRVVVIDNLSRIRSIAILAAASCFGASLMFFFIRPRERAVGWLQNDLPLIFLANTMSVALSALAVGFATSYLRKSVEVADANERLNLARRAGRFGIWDYDVASGALRWDRRTKELHGVEGDSFIGVYDDWARNVHPEDLPGTQKAFEDALASDAVFDTEYRVIRPDGSLRWIKGDAVVLRNSAGEPVRVVGSNIDLTEIRKAGEKLEEAQALAMQTQKVETVGRLAGGVAHDFNNLLAVVLGNLELLKLKLKARDLCKEELKRFVDDSIEAAQRGSELTKNMLSYARKVKLEPVIVSPNEVVGQTDTWIARTFGARVNIATDLEPGIWPTRLDPMQLQSALVNLLVNARDAIDGCGRILVTTRNVELQVALADSTGEGLSPGRYVVLSVKDDGAGIEAARLQRIFDPFFSTKAVGEGTGLGLSMVHGFVKQSGGGIEVDSEPGRGTTFKLYFRALAGTDGARDRADRRRRESGERACTAARILLVEDQADVRVVFEEMIASGGHLVTGATTADEAFERYGAGGEFDLVVTDVVMPGRLQGPSLAEAVRELHPAMPFVFVTGNGDLTEEASRRIRSEDIVLTKPISRATLLNAIRDRLDSNADGEGVRRAEARTVDPAR